VKKVLVLVVAGFLMNTALADKGDAEDLEVILPEKAQECILPVAPDAIPEDADYDRLIAAKDDVAKFQTMLLTYRECLQGAEAETEMTEGNKQAITASFNYSVDMEERVAERFNVAVRNYKERSAAE
jgi:hypothetical protein